MAPARPGSPLDIGRQLVAARSAGTPAPDGLEDLPRRQQEHLRKIWEVFGIQLRGKVDLSRAPSMAKLKVLARIATPKNAHSLWERANGMSTSQLLVEAERHAPRLSGARNIIASFYLAEDEKKDLERALKLTGQKTRGAQLYALVSFYLLKNRR